MTEQQQQLALYILHSLALENERPKWWQLLVLPRWHIHSEPLRHDASRLLRSMEANLLKPFGTRYVV